MGYLSRKNSISSQAKHYVNFRSELFMKIGFFTPRSVNPLHPRLVAFREFFQRNGQHPEFIHQSDYKPSAKTRINWLTLWFFDLYAINRCKPLIHDFDIVFINDLKYLPLAKYAKKLGKVVIYDTIDHNVYLRFYQLERKIKAAQLFKFILIPLFKRLERKYAFTYCDEIIVNSDSLNDYFYGKAHVLYYSSPLENITVANNPVNKTALLYLGAFTSDKGADQVFDLAQKMNLKLFVFGTAEQKFLPKLKGENVQHYSKLSTENLRLELEKLLKQYFLMGFSLIKAAHYSYEVQEANKDIDYLAIGAPIIGNQRLATRVKIEAGAGLFFDDPALAEKMTDHDLKETLVRNGKMLYSRKFASGLFNTGLKAIMDKYKQGFMLS